MMVKRGDKTRSGYIYLSIDEHGVRNLGVKEHGVNKSEHWISYNTALVYYITLLARGREPMCGSGLLRSVVLRIVTFCTRATASQ